MPHNKGRMVTCVAGLEYAGCMIRTADEVIHNPTYAQAAPLQSHITCYSSQRPGGTPSQPSTCHLVIEEREGEAVYHVLEGTGGGDGEGDGAVDYEVPIKSSSSRKGRERLIMPSHT